MKILQEADKNTGLLYNLIEEADKNTEKRTCF